MAFLTVPFAALAANNTSENAAAAGAAPVVRTDVTPDSRIFSNSPAADADGDGHDDKTGQRVKQSS